MAVVRDVVEPLLYLIPYCPGMMTPVVDAAAFFPVVHRISVSELAASMTVQATPSTVTVLLVPDRP